MTAAVAQSLGLIETYGGIFTSPEPNSPAADAGIVEDDVVIAVDGISFRQSDEFAAMVSRKSPGSLIHLTTFRNGELMEVRLTLRSGNCPRQQNGAVSITTSVGGRLHPCRQASLAAQDALH